MLGFMLQSERWVVEELQGRSALLMILFDSPS
jgi:hypothetical protein